MATLSAADILYMEQHVQDDRSPQLIIPAIICLVVTYLAVVLRFYARYISKVRYGTDDWFILAALVS